MTRPRLPVSVQLLLTIALLLSAVTVSCASPQTAEESAIRKVCDGQVAAWNRGDIPAFMAGYENSPETTFIGLTIAKGFAPILERYQKNYSTREQMGTLSFTDIEIRILPASTGVADYAVVTGTFHLARSAKGAATKDEGIFSLVWHKGKDGWRIILDHTS